MQLHTQTVQMRHKPLVMKTIEALGTADVDAYHQALLKTAAATYTADCLLALPISSCGLCIDDEAVRLAVGGEHLPEVSISPQHACFCGALVAAD